MPVGKFRNANEPLSGFYISPSSVFTYNSGNKFWHFQRQECYSWFVSGVVKYVCLFEKLPLQLQFLCDINHMEKMSIRKYSIPRSFLLNNNNNNKRHRTQVHPSQKPLIKQKSLNTIHVKKCAYFKNCKEFWLWWVV